MPNVKTNRRRNSPSAYALRLPHDLYTACKRKAKAEGVSINMMLVSVIAASLKPSSDMVCVPREPTEKMTAAALKAWDDRNYYATRGYVNEGDASLCYEAMLAAAQEKP